jgi:hypothetical protein
MARSLTFKHSGKSFDAELVKVDRKQLYGSVRVITQDANKRKCTVATLGSDGRTLIPRGGTALGYVNTEGDWISRDQLQPVSLAGDPVQEVPSSFDGPITLDNVVSATELLDHSVRLTYQLDMQSLAPKAFLTSLNKGNIYQFGFSYRGGVAHDPAFIFSDSDDTVWMLVTQANDVQFVSLEQAALCAGEPIADEIDNEDEGDGLDFGML